MKKLLSVLATAELLSISPWTVRSYIKQGKLRPVRIGRRVLLQQEEIQRFVESGTKSPRNLAENGAPDSPVEAPSA